MSSDETWYPYADKIVLDDCTSATFTSSAPHSQWLFRIIEKRNWINRIHLYKHRKALFKRKKERYHPELRNKQYVGNWNERLRGN